jgi:hypothetical protein
VELIAELAAEVLATGVEEERLRRALEGIARPRLPRHTATMMAARRQQLALAALSAPPSPAAEAVRRLVELVQELEGCAKEARSGMAQCPHGLAGDLQAESLRSEGGAFTAAAVMLRSVLTDLGVEVGDAESTKGG